MMYPPKDSSYSRGRRAYHGSVLQPLHHISNPYVSTRSLGRRIRHYIKCAVNPRKVSNETGSPHSSSKTPNQSPEGRIEPPDDKARSGNSFPPKDTLPHLLPNGMIRALELLPGESGPVESELIPVSLADSEQYEALSYVWGRQDHNKIVIVDGFERKVTPNLESALLRLRHPTARRRLWIDQLCISQWDQSEKAQQVGLMRDIYRGCTECLIWLGEIDEESEGFTMNDVSAAIDVVNWLAVEGLPDCEIPSTLSSDAAFEGVLKALRSLVLNSWWSRIWTVQEAVLPPQLTIIWGPFCVAFVQVKMAAQNANRGYFSKELRSFPHFWQFRVILHTFTTLVLGLEVAKTGEEALSALQRWRYRDASEPLDKVYALLGLFPSAPFPSIHSCDYESPVSTVYTRVTLDMIREEKGLRPLIGRRGEPQMTQNLPTWALDLVQYPDSTRQWRMWWGHSYRYELFRADGMKRLELNSLQNETILSVVGVQVDTITKVGNVVTEAELGDLSHIQLNSIISEWEEMLTRHVSQSATPLYPKDSITWNDAFWRTMLGDIIINKPPYRRAISAHREQYNDFRLAKSQNNLYLSLRDMVVNQAFFITRNGYIGLGPPTIQQGDEVWVLFGGRVPFTLRPKPVELVSDDNTQFVKHEFVGDAYVHGIMDGEMVVPLRNPAPNHINLWVLHPGPVPKAKLLVRTFLSPPTFVTLFYQPFKCRKHFSFSLKSNPPNQSYLRVKE
ncbi:unnamed protein product [Periconia digitata]|uniref:Heterokaryon incompatibility domain-containing protein n=1 Tax=Periconia digitata TaxID=1303443 RepID=A0A9W4US79_9PLEO|nr:unnamed protein product [Periconia digitata]